jgi:hypothetical protein
LEDRVVLERLLACNANWSNPDLTTANGSGVRDTEQDPRAIRSDAHIPHTGGDQSTHRERGKGLSNNSIGSSGIGPEHRAAASGSQ